MPFAKGESGNPAGRPKAYTLAEIRELARKAAPRMVATLITIADDKEQAPAARVAAANAVLDRGYGKPAQTIGDEEGNSMSWFELLTASQRRAGIIEGTPLRLDHDVN